jgi:hypothetical protein
MTHKIYIIILFTCIGKSYGQCPNNLIRNSGFENDIVGSDITGQFWETINGNPDIDNARDSLAPLGFWNQFPIDSSENGGNWQNIQLTLIMDNVIINPGTGDTINIVQADTISESFGQHIVLNSSLPHVIEFEFAAQILGVNPSGRSWHAAVDVLIDEEVRFTTELDTTVFMWKKSSFVFVPTKKDILLSFQINPHLRPEFVRYVAIDGVCVRPMPYISNCECPDGN